jgi:Tfp pilus assembly protein PilN
MRRWFLPMTVMGIGGLGVLLFTDRGRRAMEWMLASAEDAPARLAEWNEAAQRELDRIQNALDRVAQSLDSFETAQ